MKCIKLISFCILLFFFIFILESVAGTKDILENDGVDWIDLPEAYRIGFVVGFISGSTVALKEFFYSSPPYDFVYDFEKILKEDLDARSWGIAWKGKNLLEDIDKSIETMVLTGITAGQMKDC